MARTMLKLSTLVAVLVGCGDEQASTLEYIEQRGLVRVDSGIESEVDPEQPDAQEDAGQLVTVHADAGQATPDAAVVERPVKVVVVVDAGVGHDAAVITQPTTEDASVPTNTNGSDAGSTENENGNTPVGCTTQYFRDADGDGFGDAASFVLSCTLPTGYVLDATDCYDKNANAKPGQAARFATDRGDGSFDYDCDGVARPMSSKIASCPDLSTATCAPSGFVITANVSTPAATAGVGVTAGVGAPATPVTQQTCDYDWQVQTWQSAVLGWYDHLPPCGQVGLQNVAITFDSTAQKFSCGAPPANWSRIQECR